MTPPSPCLPAFTCLLPLTHRNRLINLGKAQKKGLPGILGLLKGLKLKVHNQYHTGKDNCIDIFQILSRTDAATSAKKLAYKKFRIMFFFVTK